MSILAQQNNEGIPEASITDNEVLDQFQIPFGEWMDQAVDWIAVELDWLLSIIKWPFESLIDFLVADILEPISWVWVVLAFFVIGSLARNVKVGAFAALGLSVCGILGNAYWLETARTIGFIGVAVLLCVIIGIPLGIACGRVDAIWQVVRPALDAMQVVHSFVYMLPFIYFFGIGEVSATMVTMVFALPPLVRLTNLGVRQVPADVVEASRAYGAPEWRVLFDVQIPLARPAIMTGINQTLLLAISMLGIAAIMGAGGLGRLLFRAINNQSVSDGAAAGLAFFLVAVVLDRISQREGETTRSLLHRIRLAWAHRRDPEQLLPSDEPETDSESTDEGSFAEITKPERASMLIAGAGGLLAVASVFLTWSSGAGFISAYGRRSDEQLVGESFNGLSASGGSWFGFLAFALGMFVLASVATTLLKPGQGPRWWTADGAVIASFALMIMMIAYLLANPSDLTVGQSDGAGVYVALVGGILASVGSVLWIRQAPHTPAHPLSARFSWGQAVGGAIAAVMIVIGAISGWSFDERADVIITPEVQAQIEELTAQAEADPRQSSVYAMQISSLEAELTADDRIIVDGISDTGPGFGIWTLIAGLVGLAVIFPAAGARDRNEHQRWFWNAIVAGVGTGIVCVGFAWVLTHVRSADDSYFSGIGSFLAVVGGVIIAFTAVPVLREFGRSKVYSDMAPPPEPASAPTEAQPTREERPVAQ
ncbi:MAG: ABC transporter permease subunit [Acidimicrobiaceae bacterium]|nr:ABC transporter permease subunit [Acidimicrobiaceae bacterium]MDE0607815.1 ABC transporter permease subunit [Acidimicrobiaceae bacterium]